MEQYHLCHRNSSDQTTYGATPAPFRERILSLRVSSHPPKKKVEPSLARGEMSRVLPPVFSSRISEARTAARDRSPNIATSTTLLRSLASGHSMPTEIAGFIKVDAPFRQLALILGIEVIRVRTGRRIHFTVPIVDHDATLDERAGCRALPDDVVERHVELWELFEVSVRANRAAVIVDDVSTPRSGREVITVPAVRESYRHSEVSSVDTLALAGMGRTHTTQVLTFCWCVERARRSPAPTVPTCRSGSRSITRSSAPQQTECALSTEGRRERTGSLARSSTRTTHSTGTTATTTSSCTRSLRFSASQGVVDRVENLAGAVDPGSSPLVGRRKLAPETLPFGVGMIGGVALFHVSGRTSSSCPTHLFKRSLRFVYAIG